MPDPTVSVPASRSWVVDDRAPEGWAGVRALAPDVVDAIEAIGRAAVTYVPRDVVEVCRARMAMLLGAPAPPAPTAGDRLADLARWPTSPRFDARDRAFLAVAEQFVIDVTGIGQADIDRLLEHVEPASAAAFVSALWHAEGLIRLGMMFGVDPW